jgi:D-amino-acid oxidase
VSENLRPHHGGAGTPRPDIQASGTLKRRGHQWLISARHGVLSCGAAMIRTQGEGRRAFLRAVVHTAAFGAVSGCAPRPFVVEPARQKRRFARVHVSRERVIRTVAGLRPFRPSGFVVRGQRMGEKFLVHNYGHGGGGITLSWGTSQLALEELGGWTGARDRCAVVGCGAVGLATARLLQRRGAAVTIYAKDLPPHTTSNIAGGQWGPFSVFDPGQTTGAFDGQFARARTLAWRLFQDLPGSEYGIRWIENYSLSDTPFPVAAPEQVRDVQDLGPREHPFPARYARRFTTMLVETSTYLAAMLREFFIAGGRVVVRDFTSSGDFVAVEEPVVFNCTGLGARALFGDEELIPVKGQLTILLPQPEVDYITLPGNGLYMFPRSDGILLGGTQERGVSTLEPNEEAEERILDSHRQFFTAMR